MKEKINCVIVKEMFEKKRFNADDIRTVFVFLATQAMIHLGELKDPLSGKEEVDPLKAKVFINLLEVLKKKTVNNLTADEANFLNDLLKNLKEILQKKGGR